MKKNKPVLAMMVLLVSSRLIGQADYKNLAELQSLEWRNPTLENVFSQPSTIIDFGEEMGSTFLNSSRNLQTCFARAFQLLGYQTGGIGPPLGGIKTIDKIREYQDGIQWESEFLTSDILPIIGILKEFTAYCMMSRTILQQSHAFTYLSELHISRISQTDSLLQSPFLQKMMLIPPFIPRQQDLRNISLATQLFLQGLDRLINRLENQSIELKDQNTPIHLNTPMGPIYLYGRGDDCISSRAFLSIDLGGNDSYTGAAGTAEVLSNPISVIIDLAGNDIYQSLEEPGMASGVMGIGALIDFAGDDQYNALQNGLAYSCLGSSLVWDCQGNDVYSCEKGHGLASAIYGVAILLDQEGDDHYRYGSFSAGFATTGGVGLFIDRQGKDHYQSNNPNTSFSLGASKGRWGSATDGINLAGGFGIFLDAKGDDRYDGYHYSLGAGYYWGLGLFLDQYGNDQFNAQSFSQGSAAHFAAGCFIDSEGDDKHNLQSCAESLTQTMAYSRDFSHAYFKDARGGDHYRFGNKSVAVNDMAGSAQFIDEAGDDQYFWINNTIYQGAPSMGQTRPFPSGMEISHSYTILRSAWQEALFIDTVGRDSIQKSGLFQSTAFVYKRNAQNILAKNLDWPIGEGYLIRNYPGEKSSWVSKYGCITFIQFKNLAQSDNENFLDAVQIRLESNEMLTPEILKSIQQMKKWKQN